MNLPASQLRPAAILLHQQLLGRLAQLCAGGCEPSNLMAGICAAEDLTGQLYQLVPAEGFCNEAEEVFFFKSLKPLFVLESEYRRRLYHAVSYGQGLYRFAEREIKRMDLLLAEHEAFATYYHQGQTHQDGLWFSQGQAPMPTPLYTGLWETDPRHTSARDTWVAGLLAVEKYRDWLVSNLENSDKRS